MDDMKEGILPESSTKSKYANNYTTAREEAVECILSLNKAMYDAGGSVMDAESLKNMSVMDFIVTVAAQNNIRFIYKK